METTTLQDNFFHEVKKINSNYLLFTLIAHNKAIGKYT